MSRGQSDMSQSDMSRGGQSNMSGGQSFNHRGAETDSHAPYTERGTDGNFDDKSHVSNPIVSRVQDLESKMREILSKMSDDGKSPITSRY